MPKVSSQKQISLKKEKKEKVLFLSAQNFICQILLELQSDMSSIIKKKKIHTLIN